MLTGNLFRNIPAPQLQEHVDTLLETPGVRLERIVSHGHTTRGDTWYDQQRDEWVVLLRGRARLVIEGQDAPVIMTPGDYVLLPAHCRHRVAWTDPETDTVWLALHVR